MITQSLRVFLVLLISVLHFGEDSSLFSQQTFSLKDTTLANEHFATGKKLLTFARYDSSKKYFEQASTIFEGIATQTENPGIWAKYIKSENAIAENLLKKGNLDSTLSLLTRTLSVALDKLGKTHLEVAATYHVLGNQHFTKGEFSKTLEYDLKALAIRKKIFGENHQTIARSYNNIGILYTIMRDLDRALENHNKALKIKLAVYGKEHPKVSSSYYNIGLVYAGKGDYKKALEFNERYLVITKNAFEADHPDLALGYNQMGSLYSDLGDYDKAQEFYKKTLRIRRKSLGENHHLVAGDYINMGNSYYRKSEYQTALQFYRNGLAIYLKTFDENHPKVGLSYNNMGAVYLEVGDYQQALNFLNKSLSIRTMSNGEYGPELFDNYHNIGTVYRKIANFEKAIEFHNKALRIGIDKLGQSHPGVGDSYSHLGDDYKEKGEISQALEFYEKSLGIRIKTFGNKHPEVGTIYNRIANAYLEQADFGQALLNCQNAIIALVSDFNNNSVDANPSLEQISLEASLLNTLETKALAYYKLYHNKSHSLQDLLQSFENFKLAVVLIDKIRVSYETEGSKLLLSSKASEIYHRAVQSVLTLSEISEGTEYKSQAFYFAEKSKSAVLWASLSDSRAKQFAGLPDEFLQKERDLKIDLTYYDTQIQKEKQKKENRDSLKIVDFEKHFFDLNREYETLITDLENNYPKYYDLKYQTRTATMSDVQAALDDRTALIEYSVGDTNLVVFVISKSKFDVINSRIDSTFAESVQQMYRSIKKLDKPGFLAGSQKLHAALIQPIEHLLDTKSKLVIIPDGALHYLPFEALVSEEKTMAVKGGPPAPTNFSELDYLVSRFEISYHHSATMYLNQTSAPEKELGLAGNFIGFAPVFRSDSKGGRIAASHRAALDTSRNEEAIRSVTVDGVRLNELKHTEEEVEAIVDLFGGEKEQSFGYFHQDASEENFKAKVGKYKYVHIATHGLINEVQPKLSGLVFSQPTDSTYSEDGILYSGETYNLDLNADLVVLSSCESGIGKLVRGEGLMALTRGFLYAGTPNIIFSLWKVSDRYTRDLMVEFYRQVVSGKSYGQALRQAKLKVIAEEATAFPSLWSSFVLVGR